MSLTTSPKGLAFIKGFEKLRLQSYQDEGGVWTIGYGVTGRGIGPGTVWTKAQADLQFAKRIKEAEKAVDHCVTVIINQNQFDALVSLTYNIGSAAMASCTAVRFINQGHFELAGQAFNLFIYVDKKISKGLIRRRKAEQRMFEGCFNAYQDGPDV